MQTFDADGQVIETNAIWHVRLPGHVELTTVRLIDVTHHTAQVEAMPSSSFRPRFMINELKFVEKVN